MTVDYDDGDDMGPEHAISALLDMLEEKGGELMKEKYGPKEEPPKDGMPVTHGHVVQVTVTPHHPGAPEPEHHEPDGDEDGMEEMLKSLLAGEDGDDGKE